MKRPLPQRLTGPLGAALAAAALGIAALVPRPGDAAPPIAPGSCSVSTGSAIAFGAYDPFSPAHLDTVGTIGLSCSARRVVTVLLGTGAAGHFAPRALRGPGGAALAYNLYTDATRTVIWGDGTAGTAAGPYEVDRGRNVNVYGRVPAGQDVPAGAYADTIVVTVLF